MSDFWSWFIIVIVVINLLGCAGLLLWNNSISAEEAAKETTGHSFDGIVERNSPLPRWWLGLFIGTLVFACVYLVLYPGLGKFDGVLGWTSSDLKPVRFFKSGSVFLVIRARPGWFLLKSGSVFEIQLGLKKPVLA